MGKHRTGRAARPLLWGAAVVLVVVAVGSAVVAVAKRGPSGPEAGSSSSALLAESTCDQTLKVVTASSFAKVLTALQPSLATGPHCVALDTAVVDGRAAAARVAEREADVWIPDDLSWAAVARGGLLADDGEGGSGTVLANSPIYMVTDTATAARLTHAGGSWLALSKLVASPDGVRLAVRDPNRSGGGVGAAGAPGAAGWGKDGGGASAAALPAAAPPHRRAPLRLAADRRRGRRPGPQGRPGAVAGRAEEPERGQGVHGGWLAPAQRRHRPAAGRPAAAAADRGAAGGPQAAPRRPRLRRLVCAGPAQQHPARGRRVRVDGPAGARHVDAADQPGAAGLSGGRSDVAGPVVAGAVVVRLAAGPAAGLPGAAVDRAADRRAAGRVGRGGQPAHRRTDRDRPVRHDPGRVQGGDRVLAGGRGQSGGGLHRRSQRGRPGVDQRAAAGDRAEEGRGPEAAGRADCRRVREAARGGHPGEGGRGRERVRVERADAGRGLGGVPARRRVGSAHLTAAPVPVRTLGG